LSDEVLKYTTTFIWLTIPEITAILEQVHEEIEEHQVFGIVWNLVRSGRTEKRHWHQLGRSNGCQFKKIASLPSIASKGTGDQLWNPKIPPEKMR
jgi:hypothetical protein